MKLCAFYLLSLAALFCFSCTNPGTGQEAPSNPPEEPVETGTDSDFIGMTAPGAGRLAESRGLRHRIISVDGSLRPVTRDFRPDRVNFTVENKKVTETSRG